jgi:CRISPR-associated protein Csm3
MKLIKKIIIKGQIETLTGLMIGGTNNAMGIGGPDKLVIRNSINDQPFIPGSSLKGKLRSLLEIADGNIGEGFANTNIKNGPSMDITKVTTLLFGSALKDTERQRPSRIIVRDASLLNPEDLSRTELLYTETKTEVVIDRITSAASPRNFERVPAGAKFNLDLVLNIFEGDPFSEKELLETLIRGLVLVQDDYIGGSGSRGNGSVKFKIETIIERTAEYYLGRTPEENIITSSIIFPKALQPAIIID